MLFILMRLSSLLGSDPPPYLWTPQAEVPQTKFIPPLQEIQHLIPPRHDRPKRKLNKGFRQWQGKRHHRQAEQRAKEG